MVRGRRALVICMVRGRHTYLCMVVDKDAYIVGIADGTLCDPRPRPLSVYVDAGSTERGVCEMATVYGNLTPLWNTEAILSHVGGVLGGIKLNEGEKKKISVKGGTGKFGTPKRSNKKGKC